MLAKYTVLLQFVISEGPMENSMDIRILSFILDQDEKTGFWMQFYSFVIIVFYSISVTAYSPLGSPDRPWAKSTDPTLLDDPKIVNLAKKYKKSPAQICIRFQIERGIIVIPKSANVDRIKQNSEVSCFPLLMQCSGPLFFIFLIAFFLSQGLH